MKNQGDDEDPDEGSGNGDSDPDWEDEGKASLHHIYYNITL